MEWWERSCNKEIIGPDHEIMNIISYFILSSEINVYQNQIKVISITSEMI